MSGRARTIPGAQLSECQVNQPFAFLFLFHSLPAPPCGPKGGCSLYKTPACAPGELIPPAWRARGSSPRTGNVLGLRAARAPESVACLPTASPGMAPRGPSPSPAPFPGSPWALPARPCCWGAPATGWTSPPTP